MNRIMVMGISAGVGKSTFARRLGDLIQVPVYHLDAFFWKPGWVQASLDEFSVSQRAIVGNRQWIIDGNYTKTYEIRVNRADTIIYLELPLSVCLYRVFWRWLTNIGRTRPDMAEGCKEKIDWAFLKFICSTYYPRRRNMKQRLHDFRAMGNIVVVLKSRKEIETFLQNVAHRDSSADSSGAHD